MVFSRPMNANIQKTLVSDYYVLYVDVLGYKQKFLSPSFDENQYLLDILGEVKAAIEKHRSFFHILTLTDCIYVGVTASAPDSFERLCKFSARLQEIATRRYQILLRGGITYGNAFFSNTQNVAFGSAVIRAYELESQKAKSPRIIIDENLRNEPYFKSSKHTLFVDSDGLHFINWMNYYDPENNPKNQRKKNLESLVISLATIETSLNESIYKTTWKESRRLSLKKRWLKKYLKRIAQEYGFEKVFQQLFKI